MVCHARCAQYCGQGEERTTNQGPMLALWDEQRLAVTKIRQRDAISRCCVRRESEARRIAGVAGSYDRL